jgi:hypothetical protein
MANPTYSDDYSHFNTNEDHYRNKKRQEQTLTVGVGCWAKYVQARK